MEVRKRDGSIVDWDAFKIGNAVLNAGATPEVSCSVANKVQAFLFSSGEDLCEVEQIQDCVERELMQMAPETAKRFILYREEHRKLRMHSPDSTALANFIHASKYARFIPNKCRRETYQETVDRVQQMHLNRWPELADTILEAFQFVRERKVLPSMRSLQFAGAPILQHNARLYNCSFTLIDRITAFSESMYLLLCGCGVGYSVQHRHVSKLPPIHSVCNDVEHFHVADTIEGWADAIRDLITSAMLGIYAEFDYSLIRSEGSPLRSGGRAPGHRPLKEAIELIRGMLTQAMGRSLKPIECHDIMCILAGAVLAGGIRRSSLISLFDADDDEMLYCKTVEEVNSSPWRALANNSAVLHRSGDIKEFRRVMGINLQCHGEPGFFFTNNYDYGCNPCGEIGLNPVIGEDTGFAFCNLTEVNGATVLDQYDFYERCHAAAVIGTLQAAYTDFTYLSKASRLIAERDALLGVSITGIQDTPGVCLSPPILKQAVDYVKAANQQIASLIGIKQAARLTTVKPSGTASLALGCVGSGIHPHHARRYFRRVTVNKNETIAQLFLEKNPHMVEVKPNGDWCIVFPVEAPRGSKTLEDLSMFRFLDDVFRVYKYWVLPGTRTEDRSDVDTQLTHSVSCTMVFNGRSEFEELIEEIWKQREWISSMAFFPYFSDKALPFMPRERVQTAADRARWQSLIENYVPLDYENLIEDECPAITFEPECTGPACEMKP